ncbi:hypothetical protein EI94DRAFT_1860520 [Lactarius quietus]|nr:hypothetical protein EI94DRAFT_1860520 [Lactarius quietus]
MGALACLIPCLILVDLTQWTWKAHVYSEVSNIPEEPVCYQGDDIDPFVASRSTPDVNPSQPGSDTDISDSELDEQPTFTEANSMFWEEDPDSDEDFELSGIHPSLEPSPKEPSNISDHGSLHMGDLGGVDMSNVAYTADLPEVVQRLWVQLLAGYTCPNHPPTQDPRDHIPSDSEKLSLKHYIAWVDSRGTVKAYSLHAEVLQMATNIEILSLYMVRKLALKLSGLSSQMVDMCPKSCMAFTGEFKDLQSCIYVHDKRLGPCGQPRFDKKGLPRA